MPKYEFMYILASTVSDDQIPAVTEQIQKFVADAGATQIEESQLGKKKLAYPIKKTRNGHYVVMNFDMDSKNINTLDAKIRTQDSTIIRYIIVNLDEHLARLEKDKIVQSKLPKRIEPVEEEAATEGAQEKTSAPKEKEEKKPAIELNEEELDKKIEEALTEDILK
jgi:small subunit ribosomal protein S6